MEIMVDGGAMTPLLEKARFMLYCLMGILVLARDVGGVGMSKYLFIGISAMICVLSACDELVYLAAFIAPLHTGIPGKFIILVIFIMYVLTKHRLKIHYKEFVFILVILLLELLGGLRGNFEIGDFLRFAACFLYSFLVILDQRKDCDGERVSIYFIAGYVTALLSVWGQMLKKYSFRQILELGIRFGGGDSTGMESTMRISFNQNDLGFLCAAVAVMSLILRKRRKKPVYLVTLFVSFLTCIMTMSRGALLSLAIGMVLYFFVTSNNIKNTLRNILIAAAGIALAVYLVYRYIPTYLTGLLDRFAQKNLLNGRDTIMLFYSGEMFEHIDRLIFGVGIQNYPGKYGYTMSAHNATQEIIIAWGLVGLCAIVFLLVRGLKTAKEINGSILAEQYIPLIILLIGLQSGQGFSNYAHILYVLVMYTVLYKEAEDAGRVEDSGYY